MVPVAPGNKSYDTVRWKIIERPFDTIPRTYTSMYETIGTSNVWDFMCFVGFIVRKLESDIHFG